ncbi:MAG: hypothetical protein VR70_17185 [Rhodospirillaceae bacterium BRH_c57]|nr:MAG: hypothetical protein VR70_17185 [Rhodospirillaceae bacterium BRH_c57]
MADDAPDKDSKTEDATDKRLEKAREEGDVPSSQEIKNLASLVVALILVAFIAPWFMSDLSAMMSGFLGQVHAYPTDQEGMIRTLVDLVAGVGWLMAAPFALAVVAGLIANVGQVGLLYTPKKLAPKLSTIDPIKGINRVISKQKVVDLIKQIFKVAIVLLAAWLIVLPAVPHPDVMAGRPVEATLKDLHWLIVLLLMTVVVAFSAVAFLDLMWTRHQRMAKLKMTKQEVKDEHKQSEGDPALKGRIRSMRTQRARQRMMAAVPTSSVVITNPTHYAVALKYDMDDMAAPKVVAKGMDFIAARIREVAEENNIPIVENPPLARALHAAVELDEEIPQDHYKAVAEVIGYVMRLKGAGKVK